MASLAMLFSLNSMGQTWPKPGPEAKAGARWWWMGSAVSKPDLKWNMEQYSRTGMGALEITPIYGVKGNEKNELKYLSDAWMDALKFTEEEGKRDGLLIDMNTGTGWPFGGPEITINDAAAKLVCSRADVNGAQLRKEGVDVSVTDEKERKFARLMCVMAYVVKDNKVIASTDLTALAKEGKKAEVTIGEDGHLVWKKADKKTSYHILAAYCSRTRQQVKRAAPGGEGYVLDHFDKGAVARYLKKYDEAFSRTGVPYPHTFFNDSYEVYNANWTPSLFDEFERRRGYRLQDHMLELLGDIDDGNKTLVDYRETLSDLLLCNFTEQWTAWAHRHGAKTRNQAHGSPANLIDVYSAVDIPEIEGFGLSDLGIKGLRTDPGFTRKNDSDVSMFKYASSAAHINGRKLVSSETFTWLTEHFRTSLSQCKPDLDLMFTCGINNIYFHGTTFSPKDAAWPGYKFYASIDMSPTNSIWHDASYFMNYIERCQSFLQMGQADNDFLVYLPVRDMWKKRSGKGEKSLLLQFDIHGMKKKAPEFIESILDIDRAGFDCDYISEKYLMGTSYSDGMIRTAAGTAYKALVIPGHEGSMSDEVKRHISQLKEQGAHIIYGTDSKDLNAAANPEALRLVKGVRALRRKNDTGYHYFIANLSPEDVAQRIPLTVSMKDARWFDPLDGRIYQADINSEGVMMNLKSGQSMILQTYDSEQSDHKNKLPVATDNVKELNGKWSLRFVESTPKVEKTFQLDNLQSWETLDDDSVKVTMGTGAYTTQVKMNKQEAQKDWSIDLGDVRESARVYVNGQLIGCAWSAPFQLHLGKAFKAGINEVKVEVTNLPANRIADMDRRGIEWRKFKDTNIVDINYKKTNYAGWKPVPSGLNSEVRLIEMK